VVGKNRENKKKQLMEKNIFSSGDNGKEPLCGKCVGKRKKHHLDRDSLTNVLGDESFARNSSER